jgi:hypothetical protein
MLRYWRPWSLTTLQSQYLLKAVDFWKANYDENCDRWRRELRDARILKDRRLQDDDGYVSGYGAFDDSDSDDDSEESEESEESDESDSGIEE